MRIRDIAQACPRFGYVRIWVLLRREGWPDNQKRVHRLYRLEGLQVRLRARQRKRVSLPAVSYRRRAGAISAGAWTSYMTSSPLAGRSAC